MNTTTVLIIAIAITLFLLTAKAGQISEKDATAYLKSGALVIDVRTASEFDSRHLTNVINIPLNEIESAVPQRVKDKSQVLLLHCASGMRSGQARKKLNSLGYTNAFNLGSYARAEKILKSAQ